MHKKLLWISIRYAYRVVESHSSPLQLCLAVECGIWLFSFAVTRACPYLCGWPQQSCLVPLLHKKGSSRSTQNQAPRISILVLREHQCTLQHSSPLPSFSLVLMSRWQPSCAWHNAWCRHSCNSGRNRQRREGSFKYCSLYVHIWVLCAIQTLWYNDYPPYAECNCQYNDSHWQCAEHRHWNCIKEV